MVKIALMSSDTGKPLYLFATERKDLKTHF